MIFQKGNLVRFKWDESIGEVLEVRDDNVSTGTKYLIKWANSRSTTDWEHGSDLVIVDKEADKQIAAKVQSKIDVATKALEAAWKAWSEARQIANDESSLYYLERNDLIDIGSFAGEAENFGWSSSSLHCS